MTPRDLKRKGRRLTLEDLHDALLLDLDGTVWEGNKPIPHAVETITHTVLPTLYVTNNASRPPEEVVRKLSAINLVARPEDIVTAAMVAASLAVDVLGKGAKVLVVGDRSFRNLAEEAGLITVDSADDGPVGVLQGHSTSTGWAELSEAAFAIQKGATYIASNRDTSLPCDRGLAVGNGSMVKAVETCTGVTALSAGKPAPAAFRIAAARCDSTSPLAVGDRLDTDIRGGNNAGIPTMHVMTGVSGHWSVLRAPEGDRPTYLAKDFRDLTIDPKELHPAPQGGFLARRKEDGSIVLTGGNPSLSLEDAAMAALRTVANRAWVAPESFAGEVRAQGVIASAAVSRWR